MIREAIDRKKGPAIIDMAPVDFPAFKTIFLDNGLQTNLFTDNTVEAIQLLIEVRGGRLAEKHRGIASAVAGNFVNGYKLPDGTDAKAYLLHRGAEIDAQAHAESLSVRVLCLRKHWNDVLHLLRLLLTTHTYPIAELEIYLSKQKNRYDVNMLKTDYRSQRAFNAAIFGIHHPMGYAFTPEDHAQITPENLIDFARTNLVPANMHFYVAGYIAQQILDDLNNNLGDKEWKGMPFTGTLPAFESVVDHKNLVKMPQTLQSSIIMGGLLPVYTDAATPAITFTNTLLGGYFGARLMQNLREEHGFTYGVHLSASMSSTASCLYISTDVGRDVTLAAIEQIVLELRKAGETVCDMEELYTVRNVLMGKALRRIDGVFNSQYTLRYLHANKASETHFKKELQQYYSLTPEDIQHTAAQYLDPDALYTIVAGDVDL